MFDPNWVCRFLRDTFGIDKERFEECQSPTVRVLFDGDRNYGNTEIHRFDHFLGLYSKQA